MAKSVTKLETARHTPIKQVEGEIISPIKQTTKGLREALFYEMELIRSGKSNPTRANAMAKMATNIVESVRLEMEIERHTQKNINPNDSGEPQGPTSKDL